MIKNRDVTITEDFGGKIVQINSIVFKGKRNVNWSEVKEYLKKYIGDSYVNNETGEEIFIGGEFPEEFTESESRKALMGANAKAKANAAVCIPEIIKAASNPVFEENKKEKHIKDAQNGWYRFDVRFSMPVFENEVVVRRNIFTARVLVNHAANGKKYLYDILAIKKETSKPQQ